jgi:hypothetical protein
MNIAEALTTVLRFAGTSKPPVMSEQDFVRNVVDGFANTGVIPTFLYGIVQQRPDMPEAQDLHEQFCEALQTIIEDRLDASTRRRIFAAADRMVLVPRRGGDGTVWFQFLPEKPAAALAHTLCLLLDPQKPYGKDLKQCQWKDCKLYPGYAGDIRRFFFVSDRRRAAVEAGKERTGKLPDRYCCEEHMLAAHRARATEATIRRRKEQREERERKLTPKAKR